MLSAGSLDVSYGKTPALSFDPRNAGGATSESIAIQSNGKLVQAGVANDPTTNKADIVVVRVQRRRHVGQQFWHQRQRLHADHHW